MWREGGSWGISPGIWPLMTPIHNEGWEAGIGPLSWESPRVWARRERGAMLKKRRGGKPWTVLLYKPHTDSQAGVTALTHGTLVSQEA